MNNQEIFTTVKNHLLAQNKKSYIPAIGCMYRGPGGLKCAIGCLIPDDKYSEELENKTIGFLREEFSRMGFNMVECSNLMANLQAIHDRFRIEEWERELIAVAQSYGLEY